MSLEDIALPRSTQGELGESPRVGETQHLPGDSTWVFTKAAAN